MPAQKCTVCKKKTPTADQFCGPACKNIHDSSSDVVCIACNIVIGKSYNTHRVCCSITCWNTTQRKQNVITHVCKQCQISFTTRRSKKNTATCSPLCASLYRKSKEWNDRRLHTLKTHNLEKYGVEHTGQRKEVMDKIQSIKLTKYGSIGYNNPEKTKHTKLAKYGDAGYSNSQRGMDTRLRRYGKSHFNEKSTVTKLAKYGTLNFSDKAKKTTLAKYGTLNFSDKSKKTVLTKYGTFSKMMLPRAYIKLKEKYKDVVIFKFDESVYTGSSGYKLYPFECVTCHAQFDDNMTNGVPPICRTCTPLVIKPTSVHETELMEFIASIYTGPVIQSDKTVLSGREIDVYLPELKLGIEINGIYWHTDSKGRHKNYHISKLNDCAEQNITLLHIWDIEWMYKKDIITSILTKLIRPELISKVFARQCDLRLITSEDTNVFLENNHLQGLDKSSIRVGLFYNNELYSVMTFVKPRFSKKHQWEISRLSTKKNHIVIGGSSKLLSWFIKTHTPTSIITYSDKRLFTGNVYNVLNFTPLSDTTPSYFYIHRGNVFNRLVYQKHKLQEKFPDTYQESLSEWENMKLAGYDRIWDCGHRRFVWTPAR